MVAPPPAPKFGLPGASALNLCAAWRGAARKSLPSEGSTSAGSSRSSSPAPSSATSDAARQAPYVPGQALQQAVAGARRPAVQLSLDGAVARPAGGTADCPSVGSAAHWAGLCKPCDFLHKGKCTNGSACKYCHLCGPEVAAQRRRQKKALRKVRTQASGGF